MKKIVYILCALFLFNIPSFAIQIEKTSQPLSYNKEVKIQINKVRTRRIIIANALLLNEYQKQKVDEIYKKYTEQEALIYVQLKNEKAIYKKLKDEKASCSIKSEQKKIISKLQNELCSLQKMEDKEFKKLLNRQQRAKYRRLKKEIELSIL